MSKLIYTYRKVILLILIVTAVVVTPYVRKGTELDNSLRIWFLQNDPALKDYDFFQHVFGNDELIILMLVDNAKWKDSSQLLKLRKLCLELEKHQDINNVFGGGNAKIIKFGLLRANATPLIADEFDRAIYERNIQENQFLRNQFFSKDGRVTRILIQLNASSDFDDRRSQIHQSIRTLVSDHFHPENQKWGGIGVIYEGLNSLSQRDFGMFLFGGYLLMFILLWLIYRDFKLIVYALGTVILATWFTLAFYGFLGYRLNLMSVLLPLIIILLGILDVIHISYMWNESEDIGDTQERLKKTLSLTWKPCFFTTVTTICGFISLVVTPMPILRVFGVFAALGILLSLVFSWYLAFLILPLTSCNQRKILSRLLILRTDWEQRFSQNRFWKVFTIVAVVVSVLGLTKIKMNTYTYGYFPKSHEVVKDHEFMVKHWGNYMPLELMVSLNDSTEILTSGLINELLELDNKLKSLDGVDNVFGYHQMIYEGLKSKYKEKVDIALRSKGLIQKSFQGIREFYPGLLMNYVSENEKAFRITISGAMTTSTELKEVIREVESMVNKSLAPYGNAEATGYQPMYATIVDYVAESQLKSLGIAVILIFILLNVMLKNLALSFAAILTNLFPVLVMFGFMGVFGINLDTATASIAAIALSFCIDDTIHFVHHYQAERGYHSTAIAARNSTLSTMMPVIILSSSLLLLGYGFMSFGNLKTVKYFGILCSVMIVSALYAQLVVFPWLLRLFDKK